MINNHDDLFLAAFGKPSQEKSPTPHLGQTWKFNMEKVKTLSFDEQYSISDLEGTPYRDLPDWVLQGGYVIASADEKKYQKDALAKTGLTQSERRAVFNAATADAQALAAMTTSELLRDSAVLDNEIAALKAKYGDELIPMLVDADPEAAKYIQGRIKVKEAEQQVTRQQEEVASSEASIAAEIANAKAAIAAQNDGVRKLSDEDLRNELLRRASLAAKAGAEAGE